MSRPRAAARWSALAALVLAALPARASTYDIFGVTARDIGMGGGMTAAAIGWSALYYNPAALTASRQQHLGAGLTLTMPSLSVERQHPSGDRATVTPETHLGISLGWTKPIPGIFEERLAVGVSFYVPAKRLVRVQGFDPQTPHFYLFQNLQDKLVIQAGIAGDPLPWLAIGLGVQILADLGGGVDLDMHITSGSFDRRDLRVSLDPTASLFAGVLVRPTDGLSVGLSYRGSSSLRFELPVRVREGDALSLDIDVAQTVLWAPHQISLGVTYVFETPRLQLAADATLALWSGAPDPSPRLSVDVEGALLEAFGLSQALDLSTRGGPIAMGFGDTLIARIGAEWAVLDWLTLRSGYFFRPTPAPRQTRSTAYLDNDAHVIALGAGVTVGNPLRARPSVVRIDLAAQVSILPRRTVFKRDPLDPVGDLSHGGAMWTVVTTVSHAY